MSTFLFKFKFILRYTDIQNRIELSAPYVYQWILLTINKENKRIRVLY